MRLARYLALCGVASRRHAEQIITSGRVFVDGKRVTDPARDVGESNVITVEGRRVHLEEREHYALNKPTGVVSTAHDPQGRSKVTDLIPSDARLYPVGRLDADTSGLILLTNDGDLANSLTHPSFEVPKTYRARVQGALSPHALGQLRSGLRLEDGPTSRAGAEVVGVSGGETVVEITIHEGRKRQVRRMCEAVGHPVIVLERVRFGPLELGDLKRGAWRALERDEVEALRQAANR